VAHVNRVFTADLSSHRFSYTLGQYSVLLSSTPELRAAIELSSYRREELRLQVSQPPTDCFWRRLEGKAFCLVRNYQPPNYLRSVVALAAVGTICFALAHFRKEINIWLIMELIVCVRIVIWFYLRNPTKVGNWLSTPPPTLLLSQGD
jgi:hypothetical protein